MAKVIISCAVTGAIHTPSMSEYLPITPEEIARSSIEAAGVPLYLSPLLIVAVFIIISMSCIFSAYFSVKKIKTLDPVMVFRG